jgi:hypothetical protein
MNTIIVKRTSPVVLKSNNTSYADVTVSINGKDYKACIVVRYENGKDVLKLDVEGMSSTMLNNLGIELDATEIFNEFTRLQTELKIKVKAEQDAKDLAIFTWWETLSKSFNLTLSMTKEKYLSEKSYDRSWLHMFKTEDYKGQTIKVTVTKRDSWFRIERDYDHKRKTTKTTKISELVAELILEAKNKIDADINYAASKKTGLENAQAVFGKDIKAGSHGYSTGRGGCNSEACYEYKQSDAWQASSIQFIKGDAGNYYIKKINGKFNAEDMKTILNILRKQEVKK